MTRLNKNGKSYTQKGNNEYYTTGSLDLQQVGGTLTVGVWFIEKQQVTLDKYPVVGTTVSGPSRSRPRLWPVSPFREERKET